MATDFKYASVSREAIFKTDQFRVLRSSLAAAIRNSSPLLIAAVGEADPAEDPSEVPLEITNRTPLGPMNLGDLKNVIVVTACDDCGDKSATLMPLANFSTTGMVQLAAPGSEVAGDATQTEYVKTSGTSEAAAFVAGVAAAMLSCYPNNYPFPENIKTRLQVTSRPVLTGDDANKVTAGIVDMRMALLDPTKTWIQRTASDITPVERKLVHWCSPTLTLLDPVSMKPIDTIFTSDISQLSDIGGPR